MSDADVIAHVERWLDEIVIGLELCPFARKERQSQRIRFAVTQVLDEEELLAALLSELEWLNTHSEVETTLLIHPNALQSFAPYNQFLNTVDALLGASGFAGTFQVASFHPGYQFADTEPCDAENYTNRSPYPLLHILRETSVERAVRQHPDIDAIPTTNISTLRALGTAHLQAMLQQLAATEPVAPAD